MFNSTTNQEILKSINSKLKGLVESNKLTSNFKGELRFEEYENPTVQDINISSSDMSVDVTLASFGETDYPLISGEENAIELLEAVFQLVAELVPDSEIKLIDEVQYLPR